MALSKEKLQILITPELTIREALQRLCSTAKRVLFVTDGLVFKGTLNDGDIRRYLLKNGSLDDKVAQAERLGVAAFPAVVEHLAVDEASFVVYRNHVVGTWRPIALAFL